MSKNFKSEKILKKINKKNTFCNFFLFFFFNIFCLPKRKEKCFYLSFAN